MIVYTYFIHKKKNLFLDACNLPLVHTAGVSMLSSPHQQGQGPNQATIYNTQGAFSPDSGVLEKWIKVR